MLIPSSSYRCRHYQNFNNAFFLRAIFKNLFGSNPFLGIYPQYISGVSAISQQLPSLDLYFFFFNEQMDHFVVPSQRWEGKGTIKSFTLAKVLSCFHKEHRASNYTSGYVHENLLKVAALCMSHKATGAAAEKKKECVLCLLKACLVGNFSASGSFFSDSLVHFQSPLLPLCSLKVITGEEAPSGLQWICDLAPLLSLCLNETCVNLTL